jgi:hypothetical protein
VRHGRADRRHGRADRRHGRADRRHGRADRRHGRADRRHGRADRRHGRADRRHGRADRRHGRADRRHWRADRRHWRADRRHMKPERPSARAARGFVEPSDRAARVVVSTKLAGLLVGLVCQSVTHGSRSTHRTRKRHGRAEKRHLRPERRQLRLPGASWEHSHRALGVSRRCKAGRPSCGLAHQSVTQSRRSDTHRATQSPKASREIGKASQAR